MVEMIDQDMVDGMQCINHPFTKNPGGICAFCLQEKLGKLITSSFPLPKHLSSSSSSSSPSFRSDSVGNTTTTSAANLSASLSLSVSGARNVSNNNNNKIPFLLAKKKKKKMLTASASVSSTVNVVYKRSQSTRTTRDSDLSPRKRNGFWSFLHLYSSKQHSSSKKVGNFHQPLSQTEAKTEKGDLTETTMNVGSSSSSSSSSSASSSMSKRVNGAGVSSNRSGIDVIVEEDGSPNIKVTPNERKVSRSRSVGCGSRSFSGDFFERITNGFGDCTLRRVESLREGNKGKVSNSSNNPSNGGVRDMVRCGGIFGGFMIMTSSSSSSSSSSSWVSSSSAEHHQHHNHHNMGHHAGGRNRSWGWAFASPMRAFSSSSGKRGRTISDSTSKNTTPNLSAIPSLLAVRN